MYNTRAGVIDAKARLLLKVDIADREFAQQLLESLLEIAYNDGIIAGTDKSKEVVAMIMDNLVDSAVAR